MPHPTPAARRAQLAAKLAKSLIDSDSLRLKNAYPAAPGTPPNLCARALRKELRTAEHAARLIVTSRDSAPLDPSGYLEKVLDCIRGAPEFVIIPGASRPESAEAIVVRRGLLGSDQTARALIPETRKSTCRRSGKALYATSAEAEADAARLAANHGGLPNSTYHCSECGAWHRTSQPSPIPPTPRRH
ncbi:hypothetical protein [Streptomyces albidoflavus]|uniref:hypothetical protein n=1 Tax=Streptomyces albidoflavus TaxID=1886 RepID=UPI0033ECE7AF